MSVCMHIYMCVCVTLVGMIIDYALNDTGHVGS